MQSPLDEISESALQLFPMLKRLLKGDPDDPARVPFRNQSYFILRMLERRGSLPMSVIAKRLAIAKQNMTTLIDKLTQDGLVERRSDINDRRIINIILTERGIEFLKESRSALRKIIKKNLSELGNEDIASLDSAFQTIRAVLSKLDKSNRNESD